MIMRLLGLLTGSAIAVGVLLLFIGVPEFVDSNDEDIKPSVIRMPRPAAENVTMTDPTDEPGSNPVQTGFEPGSSVELAAVPEVTPTKSDVPLAELGVAGSPTEPQTNEQLWFAFWSPFRSEVAASGFVAQLQRVTGLDYRVVKIEPGQYEVAFAYTDDTEIDSYLSQISAATGLDMPDADSLDSW